MIELLIEALGCFIAGCLGGFVAAKIFYYLVDKKQSKKSSQNSVPAKPRTSTKRPKIVVLEDEDLYAREKNND